MKENTYTYVTKLYVKYREENKQTQFISMFKSSINIKYGCLKRNSFQQIYQLRIKK